MGGGKEREKGDGGAMTSTQNPQFPVWTYASPSGVCGISRLSTVPLLPSNVQLAQDGDLGR